jgi:flagellar biosynthesis protein FliR
VTGLFGPLADLAGLAEAWIWHAALVFLRVGAAVALLPGIGEQMVPVRVKVALAVALTAIVAPAVPPLPGPPPVTAIFVEAAAGLMLGFGLRLLVLGLQTAGTLAAQSITLTQMFNGTGPEPAPIVSNILVLAGIALFLALGGLPRSVELLVLSYDLIGLGAAPGPAEMARWGLARIAGAFALAFSLAAPFVLAALLYNLALGAINRAMPQLMVTLVGAPALMLGGLMLMAVAAPVVLTAWRAALAAALSAPFGG